MTRDRVALILGLIGLVIWPLSYAWIPSAGRNPPWIQVVVPLAEWGAIASAIAAIWLGMRSRLEAPGTVGALWAPRIGGLTLGLMVVAFVVLSATYRSPT